VQELDVAKPVLGGGAGPVLDVRVLIFEPGDGDDGAIDGECSGIDGLHDYSLPQRPR
jgi:hypothetical protein